MTTKNRGSMVLAAALLMTAFYSNLASATWSVDWSNNKPVCKTETVSTIEAGPAAYHTLYNSIKTTTVTLQNFEIRTEDGNVVKVKTDPMVVNLQDLSGFSKGLKLHLAQVTFPGGAATIDVAEVIVDVVKDSHPTAGTGTVAGQGTVVCPLDCQPSRLHFYTGAAITLGHDDYNLKVVFTALNGIQIDATTKVTQTKCCTNNHSCSKNGDKDKDKDHESCTTTQDPAGNADLKCKITNKRYPITTIPLSIDDAP